MRQGLYHRSAYHRRRTRQERSHGQKEFGVREDNRKVYVYSETDEKEYLLYDFSLKEGDTCAFYDIDSGEMVKLKVLKEGTFPEACWTMKQWWSKSGLYVLG